MREYSPAALAFACVMALVVIVAMVYAFHAKWDEGDNVE